MKVLISADIEGTNSTVVWPETEMGQHDYESYFRPRMAKEVSRVASGIHSVDQEGQILIKDAHDYARNLIPELLPEYTLLHRGWEGSPCSMMAGLTKDTDGVFYTGYHAGARSMGNPLSHTMNTRNVSVMINGHFASEFEINSYYAAYMGVPVVFIAGDSDICQTAKSFNPNIRTVSTKTGAHNAVISRHPAVSDQELESVAREAMEALKKDKDQFTFPLPKHFDIVIHYKDVKDAYPNSFFPGAKLVDTDKVAFSSDDWYECLVALKFIL